MRRRLISLLLFALLSSSPASAMFYKLGTPVTVGTGITVTPTIPAAATTGMALIANLALNGAPSILVIPSGWTSIDQGVATSNSAIWSGQFYHCYTSGDSNPVFSWTGAETGGATVYALTDENCTGSPVDQHSRASSATTSAAISVAGLTPSAANSDVLYIVISDSTVNSFAYPFAEFAGSNAYTGFNQYIGYIATNGTSAPATFAATVGSTNWIVEQIIFKPVAFPAWQKIHGIQKASTSGATSLTVTAPPVANNDTLDAFVTISGSHTVSAPGFTADLTQAWSGCCNSGRVVHLCKVASSESGNYVFTPDSSAEMHVVLMTVVGSQCTADDKQSNTTTSSFTSWATHTVTLTNPKEFVLNAWTGYANNITVPALLLAETTTSNISDGSNIDMELNSGTSSASTATAGSQEWNSMSIAKLNTLSAPKAGEAPLFGSFP